VAENYLKKIRENLGEGDVTEDVMIKVLLASVRACVTHGSKDIEHDGMVFTVTDETVECLRQFAKDYELRDPLLSVELDQAVAAYDERFDGSEE